MTVVCDTSSVPVGERADFWVAASSDLFVPLECRPHDRGSFRGLLEAGTLGELALSRLDVSPHTIRRTRRLAADSKGDRYKLSLLLGGQACVVQDGRETVLDPGDLSLYDCSRPYSIVGGEGFRMLVCMIPHAFLGFAPERVARITATRIPSNKGVAWAFAPFLERLVDLVVRDEAPAPVHRVAASVVDLIESLCADASGGSTATHAPSRVELLMRARAHAETHLSDPSLGPVELAAAAHVSTRYLYKLFAEEGATVSGWIRERRLDRCRRDLADPTLRGETVTSIGARYGLTSPAHLSRLFRREYGMSPSEYRAQRLPPVR